MPRYEFKTSKKASRIMKCIRSKDTKAECLYRKRLWILGYRYRKNYAKLPGKPDVAFSTHKLAIFVDGEFWHGYDLEVVKTKLKSNREYWIAKIQNNINRDVKINQQLNSLGWTVKRFWEKDILKNLDACVQETISLINKIK